MLDRSRVAQRDEVERFLDLVLQVRLRATVMIEGLARFPEVTWPNDPPHLGTIL